jgi:dephospho-CoA kinase
MTIVIGLTGGIGSGKSTIAHYMEEFGAGVIDADKVGHEVLKHGTRAWHDVIQQFGTGVLGVDGEIDRKKLGQVVFGNAEARLRLNQIMWSRIWETIMARIEGFRKRGTPVVVVEAFGLIEAGWDKLVDRVWVVVVSEKLVIERLRKQRQMSEAEIVSRIKSQLSTEERTRHADVVIQNEGEPEAVKATVREFFDHLGAT